MKFGLRYHCLLVVLLFFTTSLLFAGDKDKDKDGDKVSCPGIG